jgi:hypothetical protein
LNKEDWKSPRNKVFLNFSPPSSRNQAIHTRKVENSKMAVRGSRKRASYSEILETLEIHLAGKATKKSENF